jgi:hypothetical protein
MTNKTINLRSLLESPISFQHWLLCQVGPPRKKTHSRTFQRNFGAAWIHMQAGYVDTESGKEEQPLPSGALPRLIMMYLVKQAITKKTTEILLGTSPKNFMQLLGISADGGKRYDHLREQMNALVACQIQMGFKGQTFNIATVKSYQTWPSRDNDHQSALWPAKIVLSSDFYESLLENAVPLNEHAIHCLKSSALALDIYAWLGSRLHKLEKKTPITWSAMKAQFGHEYASNRFGSANFRTEMITQLKKIIDVYPAANISWDNEQLILEPSEPPVSKLPVLQRKNNIGLG